MNKNQTPKIAHQIDFQQYIFIHRLGTEYIYTEQDRNALKWFIQENMAILSGLTTLEKLNQDPRIDVNWHVPKLVDKPIISAYVDFIYITKQPQNDQKGSIASYSSYFRRIDEAHNWYSADIDCSRGSGVLYYDMMQFTAQDFNQLGLKFVRKYFLKDLPRSEQEKYSDGFAPPAEVSDEIVYKNISEHNFAFYEMAAQQNGHKLKLTFVVSRKRELENAKSGLPLAWNKLYIERVE